MRQGRFYSRVYRFLGSWQLTKNVLRVQMDKDDHGNAG